MKRSHKVIVALTVKEILDVIRAVACHEDAGN